MNQHSPHRYICIEGPIAVGKTTLCHKIAERFDAKVVLEEFTDNPFLKEFYKDPQAVAFQTQVYFLMARFKQQERLRQQELFRRGQVSDYLFAKDKVFACMNLSDSELVLYERIYELIVPNILVPDLVVYLRARPEVLMERLHKRGRSMEVDLEQSYLENLMDRYDDFFQHYTDSPSLVLDTSNVDIERNPEDFERIIELINSTSEGQTRVTLNSNQG